jgi:hypothetical protein
VTTVETSWRPDVSGTYWRPFACLDDIGMPAPPPDYGDELSTTICRAWLTLYRERRGAYDRWWRDQIALATRAIGYVRGRMTGSESAVVADIRGPAHLAAFGVDGWAHAIRGVYAEPGCRRDGRGLHDGACVLVRIEEMFGGGDGWFGPPGTRVYDRYYPVEGRSPWVVPDPDPGYDTMVAAHRAARASAEARYRDAEMRVRAALVALRDRLRDRPSTRPEYGPRDEWGRSYRLVPSRWTIQCDQAEERLLGQIRNIEPSLDYYGRRTPERWRTECHEPIDIWPGRGPRPRVALPVLRPISGGWYDAMIAYQVL